MKKFREGSCVSLILWSYSGNVIKMKKLRHLKILLLSKGKSSFSISITGDDTLSQQESSSEKISSKE